MEKCENRTIYPVILPVPQEDRQLILRDKVLNLSRHARSALKVSARKSGVPLGALLKDESGAPLPFDGYHWSVTHKSEYVGGVIAPSRVGIDIEKIRTCSELLFKKTADEAEWSLADTDPKILFFRYWTSKEAVLKATGKGIWSLDECRVERVIDENHLVINCENKMWLIEHIFFDRHIASVVKDTFTVQWSLL
jgi:4'-phosphopantetheinyl transferase